VPVEEPSTASTTEVTAVFKKDIPNAADCRLQLADQSRAASCFKPLVVGSFRWNSNEVRVAQTESPLHRPSTKIANLAIPTETDSLVHQVEPPGQNMFTLGLPEYEQNLWKSGSGAF
jgi:hypothetical protein